MHPVMLLAFPFVAFESFIMFPVLNPFMMNFLSSLDVRFMRARMAFALPFTEASLTDIQYSRIVSFQQLKVSAKAVLANVLACFRFKACKLGEELVRCAQTFSAISLSHACMQYMQQVSNSLDGNI